MYCLYCPCVVHHTSDDADDEDHDDNDGDIDDDDDDDEGHVDDDKCTRTITR